MNHPAGRIGKRLILRVHDVMLTGSALPLAAPDTLIMEVQCVLACTVSLLHIYTSSQHTNGKEALVCQLSNIVPYCLKTIN